MLDKAKKALHSRPAKLREEEEKATSTPSPQAPPDNSKFHKSPTAPAGQVVGRPTPPSEMLDRKRKNEDAAMGKTRLTTDDKKY